MWTLLALVVLNLAYAVIYLLLVSAFSTSVFPSGKSFWLSDGCMFTSWLVLLVITFVLTQVVFEVYILCIVQSRKNNANLQWEDVVALYLSYIIMLFAVATAATLAACCF